MRGHKIGLTSRAMQQSSQIDEPDYGTLLDDMFFDAGGDIPTERFIAPRVEVELAFVLQAQLQGPERHVDRRARRDRLRAPAIEIIDARIEQFDRHTKAMRKVLRHHQRQRRQCRHRARRPQGASPRESTCPGSAPAAPERRRRGDRAGRRRAEPPGHRRRLAGEQARALGRVPGGRRGRAGAAPSRGRRARGRATSSMPTTAPLGPIAFRFV